MHFTKLERLMLINQYETLKRLDPKGEKHYDQIIEILTEGYKIFYADVAAFIKSDMSEKDCILVTEVLQMYRVIEAYKRDYPLDVEVINNQFGRFAGFDGNHEVECKALTKFLIYKRGEWAEQKQYERETDGFTSHWPMKDVYARMLEAWKSLGQPVTLNAEQVRAILQAAPAPAAAC